MTEILDEEFIPHISRNEKLFSRPLLIISGCAFLLGFIFHIQHWPFSGLLIVVGSALISGHLLSRIITRKSGFVVKMAGLSVFILLSLYNMVRGNQVSMMIYGGIILFMTLIELFRSRKISRQRQE